MEFDDFLSVATGNVPWEDHAAATGSSADKGPTEAADQLTPSGPPAPKYEAFRADVVLDSFALKLECVCAWRGHVLAGVGDGSVLFLSAPTAAADSGATPRWQVVKVHRGADRRTVTQMAVIEARALLLSLTDEGVNLHTLPGMQLKCQSQRSRGATCFAWNEERGALAVAVKRKVIFYSLVGADLVQQYEHAIPELIACMTWAGDHLFLGSRTRYSTLNPANGAVAEVCNTGNATAPPSVVVAPSGEVLLTRDAGTYFFSVDGKPSRRAHLAWSAAPSGGVTCSTHYALALLPGAVEVRSLRRAAERHVVHRLEVPNAHAVGPAPAADGSILVALTGDRGIRRLVPVPLWEQATTLASLGEFAEALALGALMPEEHAGQRRALEDRLRLQYGHYLFAEGEFDEAMAQFALCSRTPPLVLLRLFPSLVAEQRRALLPETLFGEPLPAVTEPIGDAFRTGAALLLPYLMSHRSRLIAARVDGERRLMHGTASTSRNADIAAQIAAGVRPASAAAVGGTSRRTGRSPSVLGPGASDDLHTKGSNGSSGDDTTNGSRMSLDSERGGSGSAAVANGGGPRSGGVEAHEDGGGGGGGAGAASEGEVVDAEVLLSVIDTAIVKVMVLMPDTGALLRFVQQANHIDLDEGEKVLSGAGMYAELAALYKYNGQHAKGLQVLQQCSQDPSSFAIPPRGAATDLPGLPGVWAAVRYLVSLGAADVALIQQHSKWVLQADPEAGLQAFLQMRPPLDPSMVLSILGQTSRHYCAMYLETALQIGVALPQDYHNELLLIYLQDILQPAQQRLADARAAKARRVRRDAHHRPRSSLSDFISADGLVAGDFELLFPITAPHERGHRTSASGSRYSSRPVSPPTSTSEPTPGPTSLADVHDSKPPGEGGPPVDLPMPRARGTTPARSSTSVPGSTSVAAKAAAAVATAVEAAAAAAAEAAEDEPITSTELYLRLKDLVYTSPYIDPEYVLDKLPRGQLMEIRALMLERLNRHRDALRLYVHSLKDVELAEAYCDRVFDVARRCEVQGVTVGPQPVLPFGRKAGDIYLELVQAILDGPETAGVPPAAAASASLDSTTWQPLAWVLSRKVDRLDPMQVLQMLPESVTLAEVMPFVGSVLHCAVETRRRQSISRHLRRLENLMVREEAVLVRQQRILLTPERLCGQCYKRIGNSAFVAYPNQQLAHYLCYKRAAGTLGLAGAANGVNGLGPAVPLSGSGGDAGGTGAGSGAGGSGSGSLPQMVAAAVAGRGGDRGVSPATPPRMSPATTSKSVLAS